MDANPPRSFRKWKWIFYAFVALVIIPAAIFSGWAWATLHFAYSRGDRAGFVQKISRKGWFCKTWEGELAMVNLPGTTPEIFPFSVRDEKVVEQLKQTLGQRVVVVYDQHVGIPTSCFGETEYFAVEVRPVPKEDQSPTTPGGTGPAPLPVNPAH